MILNNIDLNLHYDKQRDILYVQWPEFGPYTAEHLEEPFAEIMNALSRTKAKNFILDASNCKVKHSAESFRRIMELMVSGFAQTKLRKIARIKRPCSSYASLFEKDFQEISIAMGLHIAFRNFADKESALAWLQKES